MPVSINPYKGAWTNTQVIHLLKRTMFGARIDDIAYFQKRTVTQAIDELLIPQKNVTLPLNNYSGVNAYVDTTGLKLGETWVNSKYGDGNDNGRRLTSMKAWWVGQLIDQQRSLEEKMTLFWSNHFSTQTSTVLDARFIYRTQNTIRTLSLGNFKAMAKAVTIDPGMLVYLNGRSSTLTAPDENYGRELQELFTVGRGLNSKYTEDDVKAAAKVLTGFQVIQDPVGYTFNANRHDKTDKTFSAFYGNKVIKGRTGADGEKEVDDLLDMIFAQNEVASFLCRELYRFFFYYDITAEVEQNFITPLAKVFRDNNYEIKPVLKVMFLSEHFYDATISGAIIKAPLDSVVGLCREAGVVFPTVADDLDSTYTFWRNIQQQAAVLQQDIGDPPNVSGWQAYYQEPQYHELWISTDTYPKRKTFTDLMVGTSSNVPSGFQKNGKKISVDAISLVKKLKNPENPNLLIDQLLEVFYRVDIAKEIKDAWKKDIVLKGQSTDSYWTDAWNAHLAKPSDTMAKGIVESILRGLLFTIVTQPEYQLS